MSSLTPQNVASVGARIAAARRQKRLTQRDLADAIGVSPYIIEKIERGRADPLMYRERIEELTELRLGGEGQITLPRGLTQRHTASWVPADLSSSTLPVVAVIAILVLVRFFTEVVPVAPRAANFVDIPLFVGLSIVAIARPRAQSGGWYLGLAGASLLFLFVAIVSSVWNIQRVDPAPVTVFLYGFLAPFAIYAAVYRIWPAGNAFALSRALVALGLVQLLVVATIDLPRFAGSHNPDQIGGTFGTNAYQLVFFVLIVVALLIGIATFEPARPVARFAPLVILACLATIVLAQYRALLLGLVVAAFAVAILLGGRVRGVAVTTFAVVAFAIVFSYIGRDLPVLKLNSTVSSLATNPGTYVSARWKVAQTVSRLYSDIPSAIAVGTGPGTYSSRAWQTFAKSNSTSASNVAGSYALSLTGGRVYTTDVSNKYVVPQLQTGTVLQGSKAVSSPFSSYTSLLAEVGLLGFAAITLPYLIAVRRAWGMARIALRSPQRGDALPALTLATFVALITLLQLALLENWFEVTRATFVAWAMLAVTAKELDARERQ